MSSILTNMSAMTAVQNLAATQKALADTQNEISTGLKVSSAKDNAAYYSIATAMRTQVGNLSTVTDSLNLGSSVLGTAASALTSITGILQKMQADLTSAQQAGTDKDAIQTDITSLQAQLKSSIQSASFNGVNLLDGSQVGTDQGGSSATTGKTGASFVSTVTGSGATTAVQYLAVDGVSTNFGQYTAGTAASGTSGQTGYVAATPASNSGSLFNVAVTSGSTTSNVDILAGSSATAATAAGTGTTATNAQLELKISSSSTQDQIASFISAVGTAISNVTKASEVIGSAQKNIDLQSSFISSLSDSITTGVGSLVDADMNEASTRLNALQTQQQLGVQALSVANQNSQLILKLFQG